MTQSDISANGSKPLAVYSFFIRANEHYPEHKHPHHELIVVQRGRLRIRLSGVEHIAGPGDIALYSANSLHEEWAEDGEPVLTWVCVFHSEGFDVPLLCHDAHGRVQECISRLTWKFLISRFPRTGDPQACQTMLDDLLSELKRLVPDEPQTMVDRVRAYIFSHIKEPFILDDLAAVSGLSKYHFVRQYRAVTGHTPMEDARFLRVAQAHHLLMNTALPLHEIGPLVGIRDEFHLSRLLKTVYGAGPRELRQSGGQGGPEA